MPAPHGGYQDPMPAAHGVLGSVRSTCPWNGPSPTTCGEPRCHQGVGVPAICAHTRELSARPHTCATRLRAAWRKEAEVTGGRGAIACPQQLDVQAGAKAVGACGASWRGEPPWTCHFLPPSQPSGTFPKGHGSEVPLLPGQPVSPDAQGFPRPMLKAWRTCPGKGVGRPCEASQELLRAPPCLQRGPVCSARGRLQGIWPLSLPHRAGVRGTSVLPSELWATDAPDPATGSGLALGVGRWRHHMSKAGWAAWTVPREPHGRAGSHSLARTAHQTPRCASGAAWLRTPARAWPCCPEHLTVPQQTPRSQARGRRGSK
ncbi:uncharacterized protein LOC132028176 [Mustela nigripes]|uniref:uncharacterized protein LOC132028176 n=1 Tax=Mustela nigripes TaxID=77151 RepID=UPI0028166321|nr:uncharacterized protein LOC132028176 [Mustela nigripes]